MESPLPSQEEKNNNWFVEPEGERIRRELEDFLRRNKIVDIFMPIEGYHDITIEIGGKLPPEIKSVLTKWGSIYVRVDPETIKTCNRHADCDAADAKQEPNYFGVRRATHCHDEDCEDCIGR